jgi:hypothetical protein
MDCRNGSHATTYFKDLTFNENCPASTNTDAALYGLRWGDCNVTMQNVRITGTNLIDTDAEGVLYCKNATNLFSQNNTFLNCQWDNQTGRMCNFSGVQNLGSASPGRRICVSCNVTNGSTTSANANCIFLYENVEFYGGMVQDNQQYAAQGGYTGDKAFFFTSFPLAVSNARSNNRIDAVSMFGCEYVAFTSGGVNGSDVTNNNTYSWYFFNQFKQASGSGGQAIFSEASGRTNIPVTLIDHNRFTMSLGQSMFMEWSGEIFRWNIVTNCTHGIDSFSQVGVSTNQFTNNVIGNTFIGCTTPGALDLQQTNGFIIMKNNACKANTTSINITPATMALVTTDYNVLDPTVDADFVAGAHDTTGSDAGLTSNTLFPTSSGNCDGNGDTSVSDYSGDSDPFGLVLIYKPTRVSRGARDIAAVYSGAVLYPDLW